MADFRLGRLKFKWRGDWSASTAYVIDDIVKYGANSYVCVVNHTSAASETSFYSSDLSNWELHTEGLRHRGDWAPSTWYALNDVVKYGNSQYRATTQHTSGSTINFNNWDTYLNGLVFEDSWNAATNYQKGDVVTYGGYTYISEGENIGVAPAANSNAWSVLTTGFLAQGEYNSLETYEPGNVVKYGGNTYACKVVTSTEVYNISAATGNGTAATYTFTTQPTSAPFGIGDVITITGCSIGGYNGTFRVATVSTVNFSVLNTTTGSSTGGVANYVPVPTNTRFWDLIVEGFNWQGQWSSSTVYQLGDVVNRNGNSYICITSNTTGAVTAPELDSNGNYWNYMSQGGDAAQVLQETGDLLYQAAGGINRIALPAGSTGTAAEQREASGQVLTVGGSPLLPRWESNSTTAPVYYVTKEGSDANSGRSISRGFASLRHACDFIAAKTGADAPSATNPHTIYVKAGVYEETLPITIPQFVSVIGDNLRTSIIKPKTGLASDMQAIVLGTSVSHLKFGDTISNSTGTKTAKVLDSDYATNIHLLDITGGAWTTSDLYIDIVSHTHADAHDLILSNREFIAAEAYHRHAANDGAVLGIEATVKDRLEEFLDALAFNVKAGQNNKVWDFANTLTGGLIITGNNTQDTTLLNYIDSIAAQVIRNETVTVSAGNGLTQTKDTSITVDSSSPYCASVVSAITTLVGIVTTAISNGNLNATTKVEPYIAITSATTRVNNESTMFYVGSHTTVKDLIFEGMDGYAPSTTESGQDLDNATIKGVYFRLDPNSPIQKSPYIQNCTAIGGAAVGILIDGAVHAHFDNSSTPSYKSMVFDAYTQILDGGVGFYVTRGASSEVVSCFTYYAQISYSSTRGGKIRAVSGNSSYGTYGVISRGFDATENTINGNVKGLRLEIDPAAAKNGTFSSSGERIQGGTSGAIGELISDQSTSNYLYFFPVTGTFQQGEVVTGQTSTAYVTLVNNTDAVTGQKGFLLTVEGLSAGPDQGGSVELVDDGINNDPGSFVISNSSYSAPDGRGSLDVQRARLGSSIASHTGTTLIDLFADAGNGALLTANIPTGTGNNYTISVDAIAGMDPNGYLIINDEMMQIVSFPGSQSVTVNRAVEGTTEGSHSTGDAITILGVKSTAVDEVIEDFDNTANAIRVAAANILFGVDDYIKIDNEFFKITAVRPDTTGITILQFADEKVVGATDGQNFKIRYRYSQVRLTAHDFLDVGTGSKANTNWPFLPLSPNSPGNETIEDRPGRVYYVSTDQDGNFSVGKFFRVEQATGKATLDASAFDLAGLQSLRLGSIGAQLGAAIDEFSTDGTLSQNSDEKVPTQKAVKTYVDNLSGVQGNFSVGGNLTVSGSTTTIATVDVESKDRNILLGKVASGTFTGDITFGSNQITNISDLTNVAPGVEITLTGGGGTVTLGSVAVIQSLTGSTAVIDQTFQGSGSSSAANFTAGGPRNETANGGGLTVLAGADGDKSIAYSAANDRFDISESLNLASGKNLYIDGTDAVGKSGSSITVAGLTVGSTTGGIATTDDAQTLASKTLSGATLTGSLTAGGGTGTAGQLLQSTGSGVQWSTLTVDATNINNGTSNVTVAASGNITATRAGTTRLTVSSSGIDVNGEARTDTLRLDGSSSGYTTHKAAASSGSLTLTWPAAYGASNAVLTTDTSGNLSWADTTASTLLYSRGADTSTGNASMSQSIFNFKELIFQASNWSNIYMIPVDVFSGGAQHMFAAYDTYHSYATYVNAQTITIGGGTGNTFYKVWGRK